MSLLVAQGQFAAAESLYEESQTIHERHHGSENLTVIQTLDTRTHLLEKEVYRPPTFSLYGTQIEVRI